MPRKKSYSKKTKRTKKSWKRRKRKPLPLNGFPTSQIVRHRYNQVITLNPGTGTIAHNIFSANGMYDPDLSSSVYGHQPRGFDQWVSHYNHYTIVGSKITVRPVGPNTSTSSNASAIKYGVILDDDASIFTTGLYTDYTDMAESRLAGRGHLLGKDLANNKGVTKTFSSKKFFKIKDGGVMMHGYRGDISSNASEPACFGVWACSPKMADTDSIDLEVTIDYIAVWTEPKFLGES